MPCPDMSIANIRQVPLCYAAPVRVVNTLLRDGQDTLLGEEELFDGSFSSRMSAVGGVAFECSAIEGGNAPLWVYETVQQG
jgi:hypothetical protein